jgi:outer membrane protein assembly factor BamB
MTQRTHLLLALIVILMAVSAGSAGPNEDLPLGHKDFYPSADRPVGLQGDGTGHFPAGEMVTSWDFRTGKNIVWSTKLSSWGYSSPIVVGDKVFVTADFNRLICLDARTGKTLWERTNWTWDTAIPDPQKRQDLQKKWGALVGAHSEAWAVCWEIAYLTWKLDVIEAAKAGKTYEWPERGGYSHSGHARKGDSMAENHLTDEDREQLTQRMGKLSDEEIAAIRKRLAELQAVREKHQYGPSVSAYVPTFSPFKRKKKSPLREQWEKDISPHYKELVKYGVATDFWNGWLGTSFPTPCSDGENVYVNFGQSQVVCYDLQGRRKWMQVLFDPEKMGTRTAQNFSSSPLLAGDLLISLHGNDQGEGPTMWAMKKDTGELVWKQPCPFRHAYGHPYAQMTRMKHGEIDAIISGNGTIFNTADGEIIMDNLITLCGPPLVHENVAYYLSGGGQAGDGLRCAVELYREGGQTKARMIWAAVPTRGRKADRFTKAMALHMDESKIQSIDDAGEATTRVGSLFLNGKIIIGETAERVVDPKTGVATEHEIRYPRSAKSAGRHRGHLVRVGKHLVATGNDIHTGIYHATVPAKLAGVGTTGSMWQRELQLGRIGPEDILKAIRERHYLPVYSNWAMMQTTPFAQGNRLYIRTRDTMYCIGDPDQPYHSPSGAPVDARTSE